MKTTIETARIANNPTKIALFTNAEPKTGETVSIFSIFSLNGNDPVSKIVWSLFICVNASCNASGCVSPIPGPEITMFVA